MLRRQALELGNQLVVATEYEVDGLLFFKNHFEGRYLYRDMVMLEAGPPTAANPNWTYTYRFASQGGEVLWSRKEKGRFPDITELKQLVRDAVAPDKPLGHSEKPRSG